MPAVEPESEDTNFLSFSFFLYAEVWSDRERRNGGNQTRRGQF
uniref:Uncharacterized protein n=1 Tax=Rhizophora mucronata TaxID=61149 RepID=A0A2P2IYK5_RHIMU